MLRRHFDQNTWTYHSTKCIQFEQELKARDSHCHVANSANNDMVWGYRCVVFRNTWVVVIFFYSFVEDCVEVRHSQSCPHKIYTCTCVGSEMLNIYCGARCLMGLQTGRGLVLAPKAMTCKHAPKEFEMREPMPGYSAAFAKTKANAARRRIIFLLCRIFAYFKVV